MSLIPGGYMDAWLPEDYDQHLLSEARALPSWATPRDIFPQDLPSPLLMSLIPGGYMDAWLPEDYDQHLLSEARALPSWATPKHGTSPSPPSMWVTTIG